jgi:hypothetical protein
MPRPAAIPQSKAERPARIVRVRPEKAMDPILIDFIRALARAAVKAEYRRLSGEKADHAS